MRFIALVLALGTACRHQQITNQDVAAAGVLVLMVTGAMVLEGMTDDCKRNPDCQSHYPTPGDQGPVPAR
jgi:hypothetical protein